MLNMLKRFIKKAYDIGYEKGLAAGYKLGKNRMLTGQDQPRKEEKQDG